MTKRLFCFLATIFLLWIFSPFSAQAFVGQEGFPLTDGRYFPHEVVVKYKEGQNPNDFVQQVQRRAERGTTVFGLLRNVGEDLVTRLKGRETPEEALGSFKNLEAKVKVVEEDYYFAFRMRERVLGASTEGNEFPADDYFLFKTSSQIDTLAAVEEFKKDPRVVFAEPNYILRLMETPNDSYYRNGLMWGLEKIQMENAWDVNKGSKSVVVAVVDSGVDYNHADFQGGNVEIVKGRNLWPGGCGLADDDPMDQLGHGTHVAGTIGAATDNNIGVAGMNWNIKLLAVKCGCKTDEIANGPQGVVYAADHGADVINMSWGGSGYNTLRDAIEYAYGKGIVLVGAAGNTMPNGSPYIIYPAKYQEVIAVTATTSDDERASFSHYGQGADVAAPGTNIISLRSSENYMCLGTEYCYASGTSMAAPHVAGLAALILAQSPGLSPDEVKARIVDYADEITTDMPIGPRINAYQSLSAGGQPTSTPTPTPDGEATPTPTGEPTATPSPGTVTRLDLTVKLQGIDSPKRDREMTMTLDSQDYNPLFTADETGRFKGRVENPGIESGDYSLVVKELHHLTKEFSVTLFRGNNDIVRVSTGDELRAGDIDGDDDVDEEDKSALLTAYSPFSLVDPAGVFEDLNEDGYVNSLDYSLLLTNLEGVPGPTPTPTPTPIPTPIPTPTATPTPTPTPRSPLGMILFNASQGHLEEYLVELSKKKEWHLLSVNTNDPQEIKEQIIESTNTFKSIRYLLVIGSEDTIPTIDSSGLVMPYLPGSSSNAVLDNFYYGDLDDDLFVDLAVGRIPTEDINKLKVYFSQVSKESSDIFAIPYQASFRDTTCVQKNLGPRVIPNVSKEDAVSALTASTIFGIETHGGPDSWGIAGGGFSSQDIPNLTNHPVILAGSCNTAEILGKNFLWKGASAYFGYWFVSPGFDTAAPIYRKLRLGMAFGEAMKEFVNQNFSDFVVRNHDDFVGGDYPSFQTLSVISEREKIRNAAGKAAFVAGMILYGDPSLSLKKSLSEPEILEEKSNELNLTLPANDYLLGDTDPIIGDTPITFCSTNKNDLYQSWFSYTPSDDAEGNTFAELPPLSLQINPNWSSVSSGTWKIDNHDPFTVPDRVSNYFATLVRGKTQNFLVLHDHLFLKDGLSKRHFITISALK